MTDATNHCLPSILTLTNQPDESAMQNLLFIDNKWMEPALGGKIPVINPATEEVIQHVAAGTAEDIDKAVRAAHDAFYHSPWKDMPGSDRARILRAIAAGITTRKDELAELEVLDNGKPLSEARWDIEDAAGCFEYYASLCKSPDQESSESIPVSDARFSSKVTREPIGVCGAIIPWNYPLLMAAWKVAPALAAGCTMVLKPSELTSLTALELGRIVTEAGLPRGVLNIITGEGPTAGQALIDHPDVDKLAFTGSVPIGSRVMAAAARNIKQVSLELGGKSPFIVFEDADIDKAVEWIMFGIFWNQGQVCSATSRVLVQQGIYPQLLERLTEATKGIKIGNGLDSGTLLGPLVSQRQFDRVSNLVANAKAAGIRITTGGGPATGFDRGYFFEPTILADVPLDSEAWAEEIFGPVVCMRSFGDEEEAVRLANDTRFGLAAAVMSKDVGRTERVASALRAGIIWINCSQPTFVEAPWGGYKQSGIGRELGRWGLDNYLETKQVTRYISDEPWGWYLK